MILENHEVRTSGKLNLADSAGGTTTVAMIMESIEAMDLVSFSEKFVSVRAASPFSKSLSNGNFLNKYRNSIFLNSVRASIRGAIGLRTPTGLGYIPHDNQKCRPPSVPVNMILAAYDLDNAYYPKFKGTATPPPYYYAFWFLEFNVSEYDLYEPINERINPHYVFEGKERVARNYKLGFVHTGEMDEVTQNDPDSTASPPATISYLTGRAETHVFYDSLGIPLAYDQRDVTLRVNLDVDYIIPGSVD